jgi:hypothetical protein
MGQQDQGAWNLPRPGTLLARPLRGQQHHGEPAQPAGFDATYSKKLTDWARQTLLQVAQWLPGRQLIAVADSSYAVIDLLNAVRRRICMITRMRLDARLFDPPARRRPGAVGRPRVIGSRQPTLAARLADPKTCWRRLKVTGWYGRGERLLEIVSATAIWHHPGRMVPIRYVLRPGTLLPNSSRRHSCAPISTQTLSTSFVGSFVAGRPKSPLLKSDAIWEWKLRGNGQIPQSREQRRLCLGCSRWLHYGLMISTP